MSINPNENKTKLNQLWNDLKFNLPEINFNDTETITSSDENVSTLAIGSLQVNIYFNREKIKTFI